MKAALCGGVLAVVMMVSSAHAACSAQEAQDKFTEAVNVVYSSGKVPPEKLPEAGEKMNAAGTTLANGEYDKACDEYQAIIDEYGG